MIGVKWLEPLEPFAILWSFPTFKSGLLMVMDVFAPVDEKTDGMQSGEGDRNVRSARFGRRLFQNDFAPPDPHESHCSRSSAFPRLMKGAGGDEQGH